MLLDRERHQRCEPLLFAACVVATENGIGLAEFCTSRAIAQTNWEATRINGLTAMHVAATMVSGRMSDGSRNARPIATNYRSPQAGGCEISLDKKHKRAGNHCLLDRMS